jgi:pimeloyl-ACP methyl ester carboxylesterase
MRRSIATLGIVVICLGVTSKTHADSILEKSVCNRILEPFAFWLWQRSAGIPHLRDDQLSANVEVIHHRTRDGRMLQGYRLRGTEAGAPAKGLLLVAQGNATLVEWLIDRLGQFVDDGYDVYLYDYRGYAGSEGKRRLKAIVSDYREIYAELSNVHPGERLLYGMSFGGIVLLNVIGTGARFDRAVIDSTPAWVSNYGCPERYDPVRNLPENAAHMLFISGARDRVVPAADSAALLDAGAERGAQVVRSPDFAHPFMDKDPVVRTARRQLIFRFLAGR